MRKGITFVRVVQVGMSVKVQDVKFSVYSLAGFYYRKGDRVITSERDQLVPCPHVLTAYTFDLEIFPDPEIATVADGKC